MASVVGKVPRYKESTLKDITRIVSDYPVVGVVSIAGVPGPAILAMRARLKGKAELRVAKNTLLRKAIDAAKKKRPGLDKLGEKVTGQSAVIGTNLNPFKLYKELSSTRMMIPAKGGESAPEEILISAGETDFKPGPIVGELSKVGIPAGIEGGKVVIKKDKVLVKKGAVISKEIALALGKLSIKPIEVGLLLQIAFEGDMVYAPESLAVDEVAMRANMSLIARQALALALKIGWATPDTIRPLLQKAQREAIALALESGYPTKETIALLLAKAAAQAATLHRIETGEPAPTATPEAAGKDGGGKKGKKDGKGEKVSETAAAEGLGSLFGD